MARSSNRRCGPAMASMSGNNPAGAWGTGAGGRVWTWAPINNSRCTKLCSAMLWDDFIGRGKDGRGNNPETAVAVVDQPFARNPAQARYAVGEQHLERLRHRHRH